MTRGDDGISGTTFERPSFKRMIRDIEDGKIGVVLCKDLSRLGRNNALVAYYTEIFFPDNDVRFICVSENIDTGKGENEIMPFMSIPFKMSTFFGNSEHPFPEMIIMVRQSRQSGVA